MYKIDVFFRGSRHHPAGQLRQLPAPRHVVSRTAAQRRTHRTTSLSTARRQQHQLNYSQAGHKLSPCHSYSLLRSGSPLSPAGAAAVLLPQREYLPTASFYRSCPTRQICAISDGITDYPRGGGFLTSAALSPVNNAVIMSCSHLRARRERGMSNAEEVCPGGCATVQKRRGNVWTSQPGLYNNRRLGQLGGPPLCHCFYWTHLACTTRSRRRASPTTPLQITQLFKAAYVRGVGGDIKVKQSIYAPSLLVSTPRQIELHRYRRRMERKWRLDWKTVPHVAVAASQAAANRICQNCQLPALSHLTTTETLLRSQTLNEPPTYCAELIDWQKIVVSSVLLQSTPGQTLAVSSFNDNYFTSQVPPGLLASSCLTVFEDIYEDLTLIQGLVDQSKPECLKRPSPHVNLLSNDIRERYGPAGAFGEE
ncbi:hypothetical protein Bbelb_419480 [Branchiostoma belcheri]|nr:hypothetical protein Bbelb_419480 [Branchiostoma belcheri]